VLEILEGDDIGVVLLDLTMPNLNGEDLLARIAAEYPEVAVIVVSGMNRMETVVRCMKLGAFDYHVKTEEEDRLVAGVLRAIRTQELQRENREMSELFMSGELRNPGVFAGMITQDRTMLMLFSYVEAVARSPLPLLITGESGVGKALVASAAHRLSGCPGKLVAGSVAGLDDAAFSDKLFGHARGAFAGADRSQQGMVDEATDGTLFLGEIGDLCIPSQVKLLRFLQTGEYLPLGSDRPRRVKARVIASTRQDLAALEQGRSFRRDLHYRLRTHRVRVPPLRDRKQDIPLLLEHFLGEAATSLGKKKPTAPKQLAQLLQTHDFPGNVRELRAMCLDAVSRHTDRVLSMDVFLEAMGNRAGAALQSAGESGGGNPFAALERLPSFSEALELLVNEAMARAGGNQTLAARLIRLSQPALSKRLKRYRR
jgi:DNA-binding NtrC family response regulator